MNDVKYKIVFCTPALYSAGGVERVVAVKANYFSEHFGYDVTIIVTEGKGEYTRHIDYHHQRTWQPEDAAPA